VDRSVSARRDHQIIFRRLAGDFESVTYLISEHNFVWLVMQEPPDYWKHLAGFAMPSHGIDD